MSKGRVARWDDGVWDDIRKSGKRVEGISIAPSGSVHFVGDVYFETARQKLTRHRIDFATDSLMAVHALSDTDVYISGYGPKVAHFDGAGIEILDSGMANDESSYIGAICGRANDIYAGGECGVAHYDGETWRQLATPDYACLNAATTLADGRVAFAGVSGDGALLLVGDADSGLEVIELGDIAIDEELQGVAITERGDFLVTTGHTLLRAVGGEVEIELECEKADLYAVASNRAGEVVAATAAGLFWLEDGEWIPGD